MPLPNHPRRFLRILASCIGLPLAGFVAIIANLEIDLNVADLIADFLKSESRCHA